MEKYATLKDLRDAYARGDLTPATSVLTIDNDSLNVTWHAEDDKDWLRAEDVFGMHPDDVLEQALDLLGIPHEHV